MTQFRTNFNDTLPFANVGVMTLLAANTALSWTVPGSASVSYRAKFSVSSTADAWVNNGGTAAVPTSNTATAVVNQERIYPGMALYVKGGDVLSFISTTTPQVGVSLLTLPGSQ